MNGDARALLSSAVRFAVDERVRDRILAETRGNPLALLELPARADRDAAGRRVRDARRPRSREADREELRSRQLEGFPEDARRLLLVAAAEPVGDPLLVRGACERLGIAPSAVDATDGLLALQERVTFRHPLVRSAVYRSASGAGPPSDPLGAGRGHEPRPSIPTGARGIWPLPQPGPTRRSRASSSARRAGRRRAAASPPRPRSCSARSRCHRRPRSGGPSGRSPPPRRACGRARSTWRADCCRSRRPGRSTSSGAPAWILLRAEIAFAAEPRRRRSAAAAPGGATARAARRAPRARDLPRRVGRGAVRRAPRGPGRRAARRLPAVAVAPEPADAALARDLLLDGLALIFTDGHAAGGARAASARWPRSRAARSPSRRCSAGAGWRRGRRSGCGTTTAVSRSRGARSSSRATPGRSRSSPWRTTCCGQAAALGGDFELAALLVGGGRRRQGGDGTASRPTARSRSPGSAAGKPRPPS